MKRTHRLRMIRVEESGLEEWACPVCGRRMLLRWPPDCHKEVVDPGDEEACHVADDAGASAFSPARPGAGRGAGEPARPRSAAATPTRRWLRETGIPFPAQRRTSTHAP